MPEQKNPGQPYPPSKDFQMLNSVIIGAGPAGLAAAYEICKQGGESVVLERMAQVGGLSRTVTHQGCNYDIGPHRFFTKNAEVNRLFKDVVADDLRTVQRLTRILYNQKLFNYPLTPLNALFGVGVLRSMAIFGSYVQSQLRRRLWPKTPETFEHWVTDQFGYQLFDTFFKTYTEKVWGIPCSQIGADWAGQRIKGLSLGTAVWNALFPSQGKNIKTLVDEFLYPRRGAGMFYEKLARLIEEFGSTILTGRRVVRIDRERLRIRAIVVRDGSGREEEIEADSFLSSAPLTETVEMMNPAPPDNVLKACRSLRYRDHIGVHLKYEGHPFPDNWMYVHDKSVRMARISNYRTFSPEMADRDEISPLTVEYFTFEGDEIWNQSNEALVSLAGRELKQVGLCDPKRIISGFVIRSRKAYPVIEIGFQDHIRVIKSWLDQLENFLPIGRSGMFKYNNQDHAIATGLLAARTVMGLGQYDPWLVNIDAEYHEAGQAPVIRTERLRPAMQPATP
jgi:protoporphyrinogen oxidase